jgi:hypothetical protein
MSVPDGFLILLEADFEDDAQNLRKKILTKTHDRWAWMVGRDRIKTLTVGPPRHVATCRVFFSTNFWQMLRTTLKERFDLSTKHGRVVVNYNFGVGDGNSVVMSKKNLACKGLWEKLISNYDHIYIRVRSGRAEDRRSKPGTGNTVYNLYLSKGRWPLVK